MTTDYVTPRAPNQSRTDRVEPNSHRGCSMTTTQSSPRTSGVFSIRASVLIDAPRDKVWNVLLDFPAYKEWNPFTREQVVTDAQKKPVTEPLAVGHHLVIGAHIPPTMNDSVKLQRSFEVVSVLDHGRHVIAWNYVPDIPGTLGAERFQTLSEADGKTLYETDHVFFGPLAYVIKFIMRKQLQQSFDEMAAALKARSEA
ncbi:hypothetical protein BC834DRAFT_966632 [Gloeopeniophorella convolvens]|nr:hypothetical protein BC834DRAFT_966632 [Gloeopeniophorella convolvens]